MNPSHHAQKLGTDSQMRFESTCLTAEFVGRPFTITGPGPASK